MRVMEGRTFMINDRWLLFMLAKNEQVKTLWVDQAHKENSSCDIRPGSNSSYGVEENLIRECRSKKIYPYSVKIVSSEMIKKELTGLRPEDLEAMLMIVGSGRLEQTVTFFADGKLEKTFSVPDGSVVDVCKKDGLIVTKNVIHHVDSDHLLLQGQLWHMSSFLDLMKANGWHCCPEDLILGKSCASWKIGDTMFLDVIKNRKGYSYKLYDTMEKKLCSDILERPDLFINEIRDWVLKERELQGCYIDLVEGRREIAL